MTAMMKRARSATIFSDMQWLGYREQGAGYRLQVRRSPRFLLGKSFHRLRSFSAGCATDPSARTAAMTLAARFATGVRRLRAGTHRALLARSRGAPLRMTLLAERTLLDAFFVVR